MICDLGVEVGGQHLQRTPRMFPFRQGYPGLEAFFCAMLFGNSPHNANAKPIYIYIYMYCSPLFIVRVDDLGSRFLRWRGFL